CPEALCWTARRCRDIARRALTYPGPRDRKHRAPSAEDDETPAPDPVRCGRRTRAWSPLPDMKNAPTRTRSGWGRLTVAPTGFEPALPPWEGGVLGRYTTGP